MSVKRLIKRILKVLGTFLLTLILLLAIVTTAGAVFKNERGLSPWGTGFFVIATGSMAPTLPVGSLILVTEVSAESIMENDIITFFAVNGNDVVTHRVREVDVGERGYIYTTRGDANNADDSLLSYDRVIGRLLFAIPGTSVLLTIFAKIKYLGIVIIVAGILLCVIGTKGSRKKKKKEAER